MVTVVDNGMETLKIDLKNQQALVESEVNGFKQGYNSAITFAVSKIDAHLSASQTTETISEK